MSLASNSSSKSSVIGKNYSEVETFMGDDTVPPSPIITVSNKNNNNSNNNNGGSGDESNNKHKCCNHAHCRTNSNSNSNSNHNHNHNHNNNNGDGSTNDNCCDHGDRDHGDCCDGDGDSNDNERISKILLIYAGGTIGMKRLPNKGGYAPVTDYFGRQLSELSQFHDKSYHDIDMVNRLNEQEWRARGDLESNPQLMKSQPTWFISPKSPDNVRALYHLLEFDPLLDSSNMSAADWCKIGRVIRDEYDNFDAFIILHGTDTMAYSASALSFMLENLGKTVIVTGSQIPISQTRNDGFDNLLGALIIAMHYEIPEVCLFFNTKLFRGNRSSKVNSSSLKAFDSGNMAPLVTMGIDVNVNWALVRKLPTAPFRLREIQPDLCVACLKLFPGMTDDVLRNFLRPPMRGCILLTYGAGNAPDSRKEFLQVLREASDNGVIIVNCTQCVQGMVTADYASGLALYSAGVVSGGDMTGEAALAKLMYLLSNPELGDEEVKKLMTINLRGELTTRRQRERFSLRDTGFIHSVARALTDTHLADRTINANIKSALLPIVLCTLASNGDVAEIRRLHEQEGLDLNACDYDMRCALHLAACEGKFELVRYLVEHGATVNVRDRWGNTPRSEAERSQHHDIARYLEEHS